MTPLERKQALMKKFKERKTDNTQTLKSLSKLGIKINPETRIGR